MARLAVILHIAFCLAVMVEQTSSNSSWTRKVLYRTKRELVDCNSAYTFQCKSGVCINSFQICDATIDCPDRSDETADACPHNISCATGLFKCDYGACIDGNKKCNGKVDCPDGSDEKTSTCTNALIPVSDSGSKCMSGNKECNSGECIDEFSFCDGVVDCKDGSDETTDQCLDFTCPENAFQCKYGGCIETSSRCDGKKDCADNSDEECLPSVTAESITQRETQECCILPQQPEFGSYTSAACDLVQTPCKLYPGSHVSENYLLTFKCNDGYYINGTHKDTLQIFCINGNWSTYCTEQFAVCILNGQFPVCREKCSPLILLSLDIKCWYRGANINCSQPMKPGTQASIRCKQSYQQNRPFHNQIECKENGQWSYPLYECQPVCGHKNVDGAQPLIVGGIPTKHGEFPWYVGIYKKNETGYWKQNCSGSLISSHIVVTSARCTCLRRNTPLSPTDIKVGLGKYYREWTSDELNAVKADVREILISPKYTGKSTSYTHDIALLNLMASVQIDRNIMPVCVDWNREFKITPGMQGTMVGWEAAANETSRDVLVYAELPYVSSTYCIFKTNPELKRYVTTDKFCAGFNKSILVKKGDFGGGLTFTQDSLHYMYGILSHKIIGKSVQYGIFTNINNTEILDWLKEAKNKFEVETLTNN